MKKVFILTTLMSLTLFFACNKQEVQDDFVPVHHEMTSFPSSMTVGKASFTLDTSRDIFEKDILKISNNSINAVAYHWNFGNGITSTSENPEHTYEMHGNYTIKLAVTDIHGNIYQASQVAPVLCLFGGGTHDEDEGDE